MSGNKRQLGVFKFPIDDMKIGSAYAAGEHPDPDFALSGVRVWQFPLDKRRSRLLQNHCAHDTSRSE
jgi:hypothetical protein